MAVVFNYNQWIARYPEFSDYSPTLVQAFFDEAALYLDNTACSPVWDETKRALILNMLTAHIAKLNGPGTEPAAGGPELTGRLANAAEGSVSVGASLEMPGTAGWFAQTKYGLAAWQALAPYRAFRYIPGCPTRTRLFDPQP